MAQHDYNIANQSGAGFRSDLNNALSAIASTNSGDTSPTTTFANQLWIDTANNVLKIRNEGNSAWITTGISIAADNTFNIDGGTVNGVTALSFSSGSSVSTILDEDNLSSNSATALATQQSIKAYVDSQVGTVDTLAEILTNGNTTGGTDIGLSSSDITGTGNINITGTIQSSGAITGTLATAAQPNITSLGTLTALTGGTGDLNWDSGTLFVDSSSNAVGIGTDSPDGNLHVSSGSAGTVTASTDANELVLEATANVGMTLLTGNSSIARIRFGDADSNARGNIFYNHANDSLGIQTAASTAATINSSGNLLVGTTAGSFSARITAEHTSSYTFESRRTGTGSEGHVVFRNGNGAVGTIFTDGSTTTYNTSSDARLKDVTGEARGLEVINELNPIAYNWKADGKADEGLIAQEVKELVPNAVSGSEEDMYQMDYSKLVVHLVKAVKEQQTQIDALQSEIANLKGE